MRNSLALSAAVFVVLCLLFVGCTQEKQWPASPTPFVASAAASPSTAASATPAASRTPTPSAAHTPTPSPSPSPSPSVEAASCVLTATPNSFVGPAGVVIAATFKNLPSNATTATVKCFSSDPGQSISIGSQGGAFRTCAYPQAPPSGVTYEASASAGGVSCVASLTNGYNPLTAPVISMGSPSVTQANATVFWTTDVTCGSDKVEYGATTSYGTNVTNSSLPATTAHSLFLSPLTANTLYHYRVWSCSVNNNVCAVSATSTFTTLNATTLVYSFTALPPTFTASLAANSSTNQSIILNNTGNQALSVTSCTSNTTWVSTTACPSTLAVGATLSVPFLINSTNVSAAGYTAVLTFQATSASAQVSTGEITVT